MPAGSSPPCASQGELLDDEEASTVGNRKRRRKPRFRVPVAAAHGERRLWLGWRRVGGPEGGGRLIKPRDLALACGPRGGGVRSSDSEAAARSSPGRGRPELGDDQRDPRVSDPGRGRRERLRRQVGRLGPKAQAAACARRVRR
jgi:hypothetical protein